MITFLTGAFKSIWEKGKTKNKGGGKQLEVATWCPCLQACTPPFQTPHYHHATPCLELYKDSSIAKTIVVVDFFKL